MGQFGDGVAKYGERTYKELEVRARTVVFEFLRRVIIKTPVDTGRARMNWIPEVGKSPKSTETLAGTDKSGSAAQGRLAATATSFPMGETVWILNNLPYIKVLEFGQYPDPPQRGSWVKGQGWVIKSQGGYSRQAPQGMVRVTRVEFDGIAKKFMQ